MSGKRLFLKLKGENKGWLMNATGVIMEDIIISKSSWFWAMNPDKSEEKESICESRKVELPISGSVKIVLSVSVCLSVLLISALVGTVAFMQRRFKG